jgi:hypothetical protein
MLVLPYSPRLSLRVGLQCTVLLLASTSALIGHAQDAETDATSSGGNRGVVAAATAFTQGQQAELSGNFERAGELFELADRIAPTPEALRSATRNRMLAGQLASAASDAEELLRRYGDDAASRELAEQVLTRAKPELARFVLQCSEPCSAVVDGYATGTQALKTQVVYVTPGPHDLTIDFGGDASRGARVTGSAGESRTVKVTRPDKAAQPVAVSKASSARGAGDMRSAEPSATAPRRQRLSPAYFWAGAGATVAAGAITIWSGLDLLKARDDFKSSASPSRAAFDDGESKDRRTTVLIVATGALAVTTAALAVFTDFGTRDRERPRASLSVDRHAAQLTYGGTF